MKLLTKLERLNFIIGFVFQIFLSRWRKLVYKRQAVKKPLFAAKTIKFYDFTIKTKPSKKALFLRS
jgi:hypothetical protein